VILKTDMTHLANKGERREQILAGLFDAVCENVQALIKPRLGPKRVLLAGGVSRAPRVRRHFRVFLPRHGLVLVDGNGEPEFSWKRPALRSRPRISDSPSPPWRRCPRPCGAPDSTKRRRCATHCTACDA